MSSHAPDSPPALGGYHKLASIMAASPNMRIFKCFHTTNCLHLLYLQAELTNLESALGAFSRHNLDSGKVEQIQLEDWLLGIKASENGQSKQWELLLEHRRLQKEYNDFLLAYHSLCRLPPVNTVNLDTFRKWIRNTAGGDAFLQPLERCVWKKDTELTSLNDDGEHKDFLYRFIHDKLLGWYHEKIASKRKEFLIPLYYPPVSSQTIWTPLAQYKDSTITKIVTAFSTIFASVLPVLSIFVLYYLDRPVARLGTILAFTIMFSATMALITKAKRSECFGATSTFAAVLVVFVGGTSITSCKQNVC